MEEFHQNEIAVSKPELRRIPEGENFRRKDEVIGEDKVRSTFAVRQTADGPRFEKSVIFDYQGVTREQLMLLSCTNGAVVWAQRVLRDMGEGMLNPQNLNTVSVLDDVIEGAQRVVISPQDRAKRALSKLSPEEVAAILADYQTE